MSDVERIAQSYSHTLRSDLIAELNRLRAALDEANTDKLRMQADIDRISEAWSQLVQRQQRSDNAHAYDMRQIEAERDRLAEELRNAKDESLNHDALWRQVDRQWSERWAADQRAYERELRRLREYIQIIADRGLSSDLTPTMMFGGSEGAMYLAMCDYLKRIDESHRDGARAALAGEGPERNDRAEATLRKICETCKACDTCVLGEQP